MSLGFHLHIPLNYNQKSEDTKNRNWLHSSILDKSALNKCIKTMSKNTSPGPDGIVNRNLHMLPAEKQNNLHA
jgi:hypothetical protein